jgi:hypothetical protein
LQSASSRVPYSRLTSNTQLCHYRNCISHIQQQCRKSFDANIAVEDFRFRNRSNAPLWSSILKIWNIAIFNLTFMSNRILQSAWSDCFADPVDLYTMSSLPPNPPSTQSPEHHLPLKSSSSTGPRPRSYLSASPILPYPNLTLRIAHPESLHA